MTTAFRDDPIATHSAQFPLGRPWTARPAADEPSSEGARPWGLRGMNAPCPRDGLPAVSELRYDAERQVSVGPDGRPRMGPTANSVSDNDGDEGRSEDWTYDFAPDEEPVPF